MIWSKKVALTAEEVAVYLDEVFPQVRDVARIEHIDVNRARLRVFVGEQQLRPGDTVSGPTLFLAADVAFYAAVLGMIGREAQAVTTTLTINFMRRPPKADIIAEARILKLGRRLATGDVTLYSEGMEEPVAHATTSYALPG